MTDEEKKARAKSCSSGQQLRYAKSSDSTETRIKKSKSHQGKYEITSPFGYTYIASCGLKLFAEEKGGELGVTYWQLFHAYRRNIKKKKETKKKKTNNWVVVRLE